MRRHNVIDQKGRMNIDLQADRHYIATKWYGESVAIFEEEAFQRYLRKLDTDFRDNGNGRSVIRFFLSAAVTMIGEDQEGYYMSDELMAYIKHNEDFIESWDCEFTGKYSDSLPIVLLAAEHNMDNAIDMTVKRHSV